MISITNLRVGNYLQFTHSTLKIEVFCRHFTNADFHLQLLKEDITGVPLTEKLLKKCGFKKVNTVDWQNDEMDIHVSEKAMYVERIANTNRRKHYIIYLHELQNLYFALTNIELPIYLETI